MTGWAGIPDPPRQFLSRPRLFEQLDRDQRCSLALVSAPAGTGKTTLVADWVTTRGSDNTEWITFDRDEPFWPGFVGCLGRLGVPVPATTMPAGDVPLDPAVRHALASAVAAQEQHVTIVVDGYEVESAAVAADLDFLLRHTGHRLRLVLLTRADPVLPLYRYRLDETMTEVRMADLAFTDEEAQALLGQMGVGLSARSTHVLNARTKGWVTGLRLAGRMLAEREDPDSAVEDVGGASGSIAEYLLGEVLAVHPEEIRELLMATSIPDTIQPGLAEALAGRSAARTIALLVRVNVFIEKVPGHADHYRYHPFFRDLLRAELAYSSPETMDRLQRRAAEWFAEQGLLTPSVRHFVSAGAWKEAVAQVVDSAAVGQLVLGDGRDPLVRMLKDVPADLDEPSAAVVRAALALTHGDEATFGEEIDRARSHRPGASPHDKAIDLAVAVLVALRARFSEDPREAEVLALAAEEVLGDAANRSKVQAHPELAALVFAAKGIAATRQGDLERAGEVFHAGAGAAVEASADPLLVECLGYLAILACCSGDLERASSLASHALRVAADAGIPVADRSAAAQVALAYVDMERFDLRAATEHVRSAERSDFILGDPVPRTFLHVARSRLQVAQGDRAGALAAVSQAASGFVDQRNWLAERLRLELAHLEIGLEHPESALLEIESLAEGRMAAEAALVAAQAKLKVGDEAGAIELLAVACGDQSPVAVRTLAWLVECGRQIRAGAPGRARDALGNALRISAPIQLRRPFHEAPAPVRHLLVADPKLVADHEWLFEVGGRTMPRVPRRAAAAVEPRSAPVESLTPKELEVLGHLAEMLTTEEIAASMYISVNTVRTHVRNILRKLGVSRRNAAVRAARELELIPT
jgi:LuxR family maltose regulon positive regulatory protein